MAAAARAAPGRRVRRGVGSRLLKPLRAGKRRRRGRERGRRKRPRRVPACAAGGAPGPALVRRVPAAPTAAGEARNGPRRGGLPADFWDLLAQDSPGGSARSSKAPGASQVRPAFPRANARGRRHPTDLLLPAGRVREGSLQPQCTTKAESRRKLRTQEQTCSERLQRHCSGWALAWPLSCGLGVLRPRSEPGLESPLGFHFLLPAKVHPGRLK